MDQNSAGVKEIGLIEALLVTHRDSESCVGTEIAAAVRAGVQAHFFRRAVSVEVRDHRINSIDGKSIGALVSGVSICKQVGVLFKRNLCLYSAFFRGTDRAGIKTEYHTVVAYYPGREVIDRRQSDRDGLLAVSG